MLEAPARLETTRLCLRWPGQADAQRTFQGWGSDPEVTRYLAWRPHGRPAQAEVRMKQRLRDLAAGREISWLLTPREDEEQVLGMVSLFPVDHHAELGYVLGRRHWGQGYMPEAAGAVVGWALAQPGLVRVWAVTDVENRASARVLEKLGMQQEGLLRRFVIHPNVSPEPRDCLLFARVR